MVYICGVRFDYGALRVMGQWLDWYCPQALESGGSFLVAALVTPSGVIHWSTE